MLLRSGNARSGNLGAFTTQKAAAGETLCTWDMPLVAAASLDAKQAPHSLLVYDDRVMPPMNDANDLVNHSCEPAAALRFVALDREEPRAAADLVALRDLAAGEEVTFDYGSVLLNEQFGFDCRCGAASCRGRIGNWKTVPASLRDRFVAGGFGSPALLRSFAQAGYRPLRGASPDRPASARIGLEGRRILIIGGTGGIGAACVDAVANAGASAIAIAYHRQRDRALGLVRDAERQGARALALRADLASEASIRDAVQDAAAAFAGLDGLVCVGGLPFDLAQWNRTLGEVDIEFSAKAFRVDALGTLAALQSAAPALGASGSGRAVLFASTPPLTGDTVGIPYLLAKAAVIALGRSAAQSLGPRGVLVNTLALGHIETEPMSALTEAQAKELRDASSLRRGGKPEEVARMVVFLLSDACSFTTGATIPVDGGYAWPTS